MAKYTRLLTRSSGLCGPRRAAAISSPTARGVFALTGLLAGDDLHTARQDGSLADRARATEEMTTEMALYDKTDGQD